MDHQAFAQLLGNYGEFVGAIAVVITLIYLTIQVRGTAQQLQESRHLTQTQIEQSNMDNFNTWRRMAMDGEHASIWFRGINDLDALDESEKHKFFFMAAAYDWACWFLFRQQTDKGSMVDVNNNLFGDQFRHPGYRKWLTAMRPFHSDEYGVFLDQVRESVGDETLPAGQFSSLCIGEY